MPRLLFFLSLLQDFLLPSPLSFPEAGPGSGAGQLPRCLSVGVPLVGTEPFLDLPPPPGPSFPLLSQAGRTSPGTRIPTASPEPQSEFSCTKDMWAPLRPPRISWA